MAKDLDKRTIYTVLSRPISRPQYIVGNFSDDDAHHRDHEHIELAGDGCHTC